MDEVTWDELRKELIAPEDEPLIEEQRQRLIARQRAYELVEARKRRGLRQIDIAEMTGVSQARISQIEHGVISEVATLAAYVAALGGQLKVVADCGDDTMVLEVPGGKRAS